MEEVLNHSKVLIRRRRNVSAKQKLSKLAIIDDYDYYINGKVDKEVNVSAEDLVETEDDETNVNGDNFFHAIWPVLAVAQCFAIMPISGIRSGNPKKLSFRWKTIRALGTILYLLAGIAMAALYLKRIIKIGVNAKNIVGMVFFTCCTLVCILFLFLAQKWKEIASFWSANEAIFLCSPYRVSGWMMSTKIRITSTLILGLAMLEHLMYLMSAIFNYYMKITSCRWEIDDHWQLFYITEYKHVFQTVPYHFVLTLLVSWANVSFTFAWNYMDVFIILISLGLTTRFQQIYQRLLALRKGEKNITESTWQEIRKHYVLLCELLELVDKYMASIILLSCTNNLYFICFQLLNIFQKLPYLINYIYFWYSLLYLIGRTIVVFLCASAINDAARKPIHIVRHIRTNEWCTELERFAEQLSTETIALSGMKFFFLTRRLLFGMAGTIVTYELVLLQFDEGTKKAGNVSLCETIQ